MFCCLTASTARALLCMADAEFGIQVIVEMTSLTSNSSLGVTVLICTCYLSVATCRSIKADRSPKYISMLPGTLPPPPGILVTLCPWPRVFRINQRIRPSRSVPKYISMLPGALPPPPGILVTLCPWPRVSRINQRIRPSRSVPEIHQHVAGTINNHHHLASWSRYVPGRIRIDSMINRFYIPPYLSVSCRVCIPL